VETVSLCEAPDMRPTQDGTRGPSGGLLFFLRKDGVAEVRPGGALFSDEESGELSRVEGWVVEPVADVTPDHPLGFQEINLYLVHGYDPEIGPHQQVHASLEAARATFPRATPGVAESWEGFYGLSITRSRWSGDVREVDGRRVFVGAHQVEASSDVRGVTTRPTSILRPTEQEGAADAATQDRLDQDPDRGSP
jgi:hypothetical protein